MKTMKFPYYVMCYKLFYSFNRLLRAAGARHVLCYREDAKRIIAVRDVYNVANRYRWNRIHKRRCCIDSNFADARPDEAGRLHTYTTIVGNGNCLYCTISLNTFDNEDNHIYTCLKTAIQLYLHRSHYDIHSATNSGK